MIDEYLTSAKQLAKKAGDMMVSATDQQVTIKEDKTPVTVTDNAINDMVIDSVAKEFPDHGVLGEEASSHGDREWLWVCDPIDGTLAFIAGVPVSMFSVALVHNGESQVAVTYNPWTDQMYWATKGGGAYCNGKKLQVSSRSQSALIGATGSATAHNSLLNSSAGINLMREKNWTAINFIGAVQKGSLVAAGSLDGYVGGYTGAHDIAAIALLVTEAGGKVTDLYGDLQRYDKSIKGAIVSNGIIHDELVGLVRGMLQDDS